MWEESISDQEMEEDHATPLIVFQASSFIIFHYVTPNKLERMKWISLLRKNV